MTQPSDEFPRPRAGTDRAQRAETADLLEMGRKVIRQEAQAVAGIADSLDEAFATAVRWIYRCQGRVKRGGDDGS